MAAKAKNTGKAAASTPMARRPRRPRGVTTLAFETLTLEGGLLAPEWLARAAQLAAPHQTEADYAIEDGLLLRDEIGRYWRIAHARWSKMSAGRAAGGDAAVLAREFVVDLLTRCFGFTDLTPTAPVVVGARTYPIGLVAHGGRVPVVVAPLGAGLDTPAAAFGEAGRKRTPYGLCQEYLNADDAALWGLCCDGFTLRILRDNASLTRPAHLEADLARIFREDRFADFSALWLVAHATRFGRPAATAAPVLEIADAAAADGPDDADDTDDAVAAAAPAVAASTPADCPLEIWRTLGREEGTRAREHLRRGVEDALLALGQGFVSHPENTALRAALAAPPEAGGLTPLAFYQELLRLVYRLIFLLTVEERELLHPDTASAGAKQLYAEGYGLKRLRERSVRRSAHDRFADLFEGLKIVFRGLGAGEPRLGLPALAGLFAATECPTLDAARLENRALLLAMFRLSWLRESQGMNTGGLSRVNWRDMGPEELGSVYESLLELVPQITQGGRAFAFATGGETKGNARKTSGSYYTPDSLVQVLLDSALEPVVAQALAPLPEADAAGRAAALLGLSVVDPACGSGHFLLAAARRIAVHLARLRSAGGTPTSAEYRHALREVVGKCIYGVDLNPMAVELCRVSLWMEAVEPGLPLTFLDAHIRHGNALLGTTPALMEKGIPDAAWDPIEGDDKKVASALKKLNKTSAHTDQLTLGLVGAAPSTSVHLRREVDALEASSDADPAALRAKQQRWAAILASDAYRHEKLVADAWCAAFVWPKIAGPMQDAAPTNGLWRRLRDRAGPVPAATLETVDALAEQYRFFHWHLAFPKVFAKGGFDVVLGNPPWERVKLQEQEFFASLSDEIAGAVNAAARKKLIAALPTQDPALWRAWCEASREAEGQSHAARNSGRYPLCGKGDVNTYALFAEHNRSVLGPKGRAGFIVPPGLATDDTTKAFFQRLTADAALVSLYEFENEEFLFPGIDHRVRFIALTVAAGKSIGRAADLSFGLRSVVALSDKGRHFSLTPEQFAALNPNTRTCPTFRSNRDATLNLAMYARAGVLWREDAGDGNAWGLKFLAMLHMANDSGLFRTRASLESDGAVRERNTYVLDGARFVPLFEAKMVHLFDHRFGTYEGQTAAQENQGKLPEFDDAAHGDPRRLTLPYYWLPESDVEDRLAERWSRGWLLGWRDICRSTDQRTVIASLIPRVAVGHTTPLMLPDAPPTAIAALYANLCSFALDYAARQKVGGTHLTYAYLKQLPVLPPDTYAAPAPWAPKETLGDFILPRVLELTYTAWDLEPFARDVGYDGPPFRWDPERRALLRAELDAAFFHHYGLSREDTDYVLETFPIVRKNDVKAHGEYRTKRLILDAYDHMALTARSGRAYQTPLDPPPADPRVAHPSDSRPESP
ncbi:SAM-dependent methyltransferase [Myxococcota bacterium]|nr:SAM-dependent methyltransferase [Myxococcota bacterium]